VPLSVAPPLGGFTVQVLISGQWVLSLYYE